MKPSEKALLSGLQRAAGSGLRLVAGGCVGWVLWMAVVAGQGTLRAQSPFAEGNVLFQEGKFAEAESAYNRSLAQDGDSAATRLNLGRVREALGDSPGAILEWERALRLNPEYAVAREALETARATLGSKVDALPWSVRVRPSWVAGRERWVLAGGIWLALACFSVRVLAHILKRRPASNAPLLGAAFGLLLGLLGWTWSRYADAERMAALVIERAASLRAAPADPARLLDTLPGGSRVRILDASGGWNRVQAPGGETGWIPAKSIERIQSGG